MVKRLLCNVCMYVPTYMYMRHNYAYMYRIQRLCKEKKSDIKDMQRSKSVKGKTTCFTKGVKLNN